MLYVFVLLACSPGDELCIARSDGAQGVVLHSQVKGLDVLVYMVRYFFWADEMYWREVDPLNPAHASLVHKQVWQNECNNTAELATYAL